MCETTVSLVSLPLAVIKRVAVNHPSIADDMIELLLWLQENPQPNIVKIHSAVRISPLEYSYKMDRLLPLTKEEEDYLYVSFQIDELFSTRNGGESEEKFSEAEEDDVFTNSPLYNDPKMNAFHDAMGKMEDVVGGFYCDLDPSNVMKDEEGNYQFIDIEGIDHDL